MPALKDKSYGNPPLIQKVGLLASLLLHLPLTLAWAALTSPFHGVNRYKSWRRLIGDTAFNHMSTWLNAKQLQGVLGQTVDVYKAVVKSHKFPVIIEELGDDARLMWIGEKRTDRVILYLHGGAFLFPAQDFALDYWIHAQNQIKKKHGKDVGIACLNYSLVPTASFPTQLRQAVRAVQHLFSIGVSPRNLQIVGDSAGANLILQVVSHILHPVPDVPSVEFPSPLRGIYLMSPWVSLTSKGGSMITNDTSDCISRTGLLYWGSMVLDGVPDSARHYLEATKAPDGWFSGIAGLTDRLLVSGGDAECLRDDIVYIAKKLEVAWDQPLGASKKGRREDFQFILQENGVHDDPHFDFLPKEKRLSNLSWEIIDWIAKGFD